MSNILISHALALSVRGAIARGQEPATSDGQPLAANVERLVRAMESLGAPLPDEPVPELAIQETPAGSVRNRVCYRSYPIDQKTGSHQCHRAL